MMLVDNLIHSGNKLLSISLHQSHACRYITFRLLLLCSAMHGEQDVVAWKVTTGPLHACVSVGNHASRVWSRTTMA